MLPLIPHFLGILVINRKILKRTETHLFNAEPEIHFTACGDMQTQCSNSVVALAPCTVAVYNSRT